MAEGDERVAESLVMALAGQGVANGIRWVRDGLEALEYLFRTGRYSGADEAEPCLVLLDPDLPCLDGLEVLHRIRGAERTRALPVLVLARSDESEEILPTLDLDANGVLRVPADGPRLAEALLSTGLRWQLVGGTEAVRG